THLKVNDALALAGIALETGAGSLTLSGTLALTDNATLNSSGGTITLGFGASAPSGTSISLPNTTLVLENPLSLTGATLKTKNTTFTTNANALSLSNSSILEVEGVQDLSGVLPDNSVTLRLAADSTVNTDASLSFGTLDLANNALTLDDGMAGLSVVQQVTLDAAGEEIETGNADLVLNGGISVTAGALSSTGGALTLPSGATLASGASFSTSNTTLNLGGSLVVADTWTSTNTSILLTGNVSLSSTEEISLATLTTSGYDFELDSETTDLTIQDAFALTGSEVLATNGADLIFEGSVTTSSVSTIDAGDGGMLEFQNGGTAAGEINAEDAVFKIGSAYAVTGTLKTNSSTIWELGTANLDLSGARLYLGGDIVLDNIVTNNGTEFRLNGEDATVTRDEGFTLGSLDFEGFTFTLASETTDLTVDLGDSGYWELIAKQADSDVQLFSSNAKSTFLENENDPSQSTFMSIGNLNESNYADTDGKYKFKLVWDGMQVASENIKEVIWTQTSWLEDSIIQGFQEIGDSGFNDMSDGQNFEGLGKSSNNKCVIDGDASRHGNWWNCVGANAKHDGGIPGPKAKVASSMYLYIWESETDSDSPPGTL
ncbi:MAG: hypothetical protein NZ842_16170, partial [Dehalococcoidia bacterium]|nr:hypothetical protein [Dehalococcoidia bacterium]